MKNRWLPEDYGETHTEAIEKFLKVSNKSGKNVSFIPNDSQRKVLARLSGRDIIPKARQQGISTLFLACFFLDCLVYDNLRCVVIAHDADSTERLFQRVRFFLDNFIGDEIETISSTKREIRFVATNATFYVETAGNTKSGRSGTINRLLCSEVAYWPDPKAMTAGLLQSVPEQNSLVIFESTGNGAQTWYHRRCITAANPTSQYTLHFLNWKDFAEYTLKLSEVEEESIYETLDPSMEEPEVLAEHSLSAGQLAWRREKIDEMDGDLGLFRQEYPLTLEECFRSRGQSFFHRVLFEDIGEYWQQHEESWNFHRDVRHPIPSCHYVLGADVSGGVGGDYSVIEILCLEDQRQVGEYIDNKISPDAFADIIAWIGKMYNDAWVNVETNNHGGVTVTELLSKYPRNLMFSSDILSSAVYGVGTQTTRASKLSIIGLLRKNLAEGFVIVSDYLRGELSSFVEVPISDINSRLQASAGTHDDTVMALGMANVARVNYEAYLAYQGEGLVKIVNPEAEFTMKAILSERRKGKFPCISGLIEYN